MSNDELHLVLLVRDYPLVTVEQLCKLTGRPMQSVARSLLKLCLQKKPLINRNGKRESVNTKYVYAITKYAANNKDIGGYAIDLSERRDKGLRHEQMIGDVHIALRESVVYWQQHRKVLWQHGVQPDAFFKLQNGDKKRSYFLEAELGTNNPEDVLKKYRGYVRLHEKMQQSPITDWLPMKTFSVLTVCKSEEAAKTLAKNVEEERIIAPAFRRAYLFSYFTVTHCYLTGDTAGYPLLDV